MPRHLRKTAPNLALLFSGLAARLRRRRRPQPHRPALLGPAIQSDTCAEDRLLIPIREHSDDDLACRDAQARGQFLARQDRWEELTDEIRQADSARDATPGGMPIADLLAYGARSDAIHAAEEALRDGRTADDAPVRDGISGLEAVRRDHADDPLMNLVVALAHIDIGWAWRGTSAVATVPRMHQRQCAAHFERATTLLDPFSGLELDSPAIAAGQCALLAGRVDSRARVADDYEDLIDLDPLNHRHMRTLGSRLLPRWFGDYQQLELEARRTAARTQDIWGAGGYTWVCFDAIAIDEGACARVDVDFFIDGLHDIVAARPEQEMVNLLAAYCAVALPNGLGLNQDADLPRMQIADAARWLIRDHLTELHPLVWAHASDGFDNNAPVTSLSRFAARGKADALRFIAELFRDDIEGGLRVIFTPDGPEFHPS